MRRRRSSPLIALALLASCSSAQQPWTGPTSCPTVREAVLSGQDDIRRFAGCSSLHRVVVRTGMELDAKELAALEVIEGDLVIGPTTLLSAWSFPKLREVRGAIRIVANLSLNAVYFPALQRAGSIAMLGNGRIKQLSAPRLVAVAGDVKIDDAQSLELIEASRLTTIGGGLAIHGAPELTLLELGALTSVRSVAIDGSPRLDAELLARLGELPSSVE